MFITDEVRAGVNAAAAATRLAGLARGSSLSLASHAAWDAGMATTGQAGFEPGLPALVRVQYQGPARRGAVSALIVRWEAAAGDGQSFPALDADITLVPDGDQATLVGLTGVYRTPAKTPPYRLTVSWVAAVTIRTLINRIAVEISASEVPPCGESAASISRPIPGRHGRAPRGSWCASHDASSGPTNNEFSAKDLVAYNPHDLSP